MLSQDGIQSVNHEDLVYLFVFHHLCVCVGGEVCVCVFCMICLKPHQIKSQEKWH